MPCHPSQVWSLANSLHDKILRRGTVKVYLYVLSYMTVTLRETLFKLMRTYSLFALMTESYFHLSAPQMLPYTTIHV